MSQLTVSEELKRKLVSMAKEAGLSENKLAEVLLAGFIDGGGKVYSARWKEGPGLKILPDWPRFSAGIVKLKQEELV